MGIVKEYITDEGTHVIIRDDYYRDKTPEEIELIRKDIIDTATKVYWNIVERYLEKAEKEEV